jgi:predicted DNA-binding transcriptional regulator AlpA
MDQIRRLFETSATRLLTVQEVADMLQLSCGWVRDHAAGRRRPVLPSVKLGKSVRFRLEGVLRFIDECTRNAA